MSESWSAKRWSTRPGASRRPKWHRRGCRQKETSCARSSGAYKPSESEGRRLRVGEKQAVEDAEQAASLGGAAPDEILHKRVIAQRGAQHRVPTAGRDAIPPEHGLAAILKGEGWVAQGVYRGRKGRHGARADGTALGE